MVSLAIIVLILLLIIFVMVVYIAVTWVENQVFDEEIKRYFKDKYGNFNSGN